VTKLCDLGNDDGVCSVGWAHRGTHLAVGTSNGKVQVSYSLHLCWDSDTCTCCVDFNMVYGYRNALWLQKWM